MNIVCISDTHKQHARLRVPAGDVLVHAGDVSLRGTAAEIQDFLTWFAAQPHRHKVFIAGNHDFLFEQHPAQARAMIPEGVHYLEDSGVTLGGVRFWGSPVTPWFYDWAFNRREDEIRPHWALIPPNTDVLITHGPPLGVLDAVRPDHHQVGCPQLAQVLATRVAARLHVFGHIHESYGQRTQGALTSVNASVLDHRYKLLNPPVMISFDVPVPQFGANVSCL
ncbi:metallophosphatase domain-containing protein [Deinococcus ruber]|uniref:Calcineurin-like phosphoesterase domain-containing protein n=1 Tax=Deinococcus ruber TaxID=1848197 RepID=A0A918FC30_9DEIO|nr:metallophosphatase domain-containing protein [Deinococcus ruber]GGR29313.1 hypothetical protein GCM10008957_45410 [Deinococcus ruber]